MGLGPFRNGRHWPITSQDGAWFKTVNDPIPQHVKDHHANQHAATSTHRLVLPGRYDRFGRLLPR